MESDLRVTMPAWFEVQGPRLYLLFDDWSDGYSIRVIDCFSNKDQPWVPCPDLCTEPVCRMVAPRRSPEYLTSAFGTRILAMHPRDPEGCLSEGYFPMLDVHSRCVTTGPAQRHRTHPIYYLPVGKKLFTLNAECFEMLSLEEFCPRESGRYTSKKWSWEELPKHPLNVDDITSYSLHPEERTYLISTKTDTTMATFSFDTEKLSWKLLGNWMLPFTGSGHFDKRLNGFVGLSKEQGTFGQIYFCDVPNYDTDEGQCPAPRMILLKKNLSEDMVLGATLVYTGVYSTFYLVQSVSKDGIRYDEEDNISDDAFMYTLTKLTLSLHKGELTSAYLVFDCKVPRGTSKSFLFQDPVAFFL